MDDLRLPSDEKNDSSSVGDVSQKVKRLSQQQCGFIQIKNARVKSSAINKGAHLGSQRSRCVTQMHSGFEQILNSEKKVLV
jgi:hypothetical protein